MVPVQTLWPTKMHTNVNCYRKDGVTAVVQRTGKVKSQMVKTCRSLAATNFWLWSQWSHGGLFLHGPPVSYSAIRGSNFEMMKKHNPGVWSKTIFQSIYTVTKLKAFLGAHGNCLCWPGV